MLSFDCEDLNDTNENLSVMAARWYTHTFIVLFIVRFGTATAKATDISKNCPEAHCAWNGNETAFHSLWVCGFEETGRWSKKPHRHEAKVERWCLGYRWKLRFFHYGNCLFHFFPPSVILKGLCIRPFKHIWSISMLEKCELLGYLPWATK